MKKISILSLVIGLSLLAQPAFALDFSKLHVIASTAINRDCNVGDGYETVSGCFTNKYEKKAGYEALVPTPTIYLRSDLPAPLLTYVFMQNVGQYIAMHYSDQELAQVFNPTPDQFGSQDVRKAAANTFAYWALGGTVTPQKLQFFKEAFAQ